LALTIRYSDHTNIRGHRAIDPASYWDIDLTPPLHALFQQCVRRRVRMSVLMLSASGLMAPAEQCELFDAVEPTDQRRTRAQQLALTLDRLRTRFGSGIIRYGRNN
jgi:hypothetical protein